MLGKLDRYIARSFLEPFLMATAAIVGLYLVAEAFSELDEYLEQAKGFGEALSRMVQTYGLRLPTFLVPVLPISMLFGAAYGVSQMSSNNEITAMRASGVSFWRLLTPIYAMAVVVAMMGMGNRELLVPELEQIALSQERIYQGKDKSREQVAGFWEPDQTFFTMMYNPITRDAGKVTLLQKMPDGSARGVTAEEAHPERGGWRLLDVRVGAETKPELFWKTSLRARDVEMYLLPAEVQPIKMLRRMIRRAKTRQERESLLLQYYPRLAYPLTGLILVALGVPFVIGHERIQRNRLLGIGVCLIICAVFYSVQYICASLGQEGRLPPAVSAFLPIFLFSALGLYLLETVHS